ncbi:MAG: glycosyltransferase [Phycisphaerales bacterium]|nr:glycosyltransferase [Phycisphaerales bacterium]
MLLRDEADVVTQTLEHLLEWIDTLHIFDTGSTDETWDMVQDAARRDKRIVPLREPQVYSDSMRSQMFHRTRGHAER